MQALIVHFYSLSKLAKLQNMATLVHNSVFHMHTTP